MVALNPQAAELNRIIKNGNPAVFDLLSQKGQSIYFPKEGILAQSAEAKGTKYNATIGIALDEDKTPTRLPSIAGKIKLPPKDVFPYAPSFGKMELRESWLANIKKKNPDLKTVTSLPIVTSALTHALSIIGYLFVNPEDKIILADKFWGNYRLIFEYGFEAVLDTYNTFAGNSFDLSAFEKKINDSKGQKIILLFNFPNNPAGYTPTVKEAKQLVTIINKQAAKGKKILVILDDAYFGLVYKSGIITQSLFPFLSNLHKNVLAVKLDAVTKEEYAWGLRIGFITYGGQNLDKEAYQALEAKTAGAVRGSISNASHLSQSLILTGLSSSSYRKEKQQNYLMLKKRFQMVEKVLKVKKYQEYFSPLPFNSGYFMCLELKKGLEGEKVRQTLIKKYDTGVIAIKNLLRIAYSSVPTSDIPQLFENIYLACRETITVLT
ncbi:aminotransferase class I/II-fold pyridoxal phosphate-dependent enzyme [Candidatus Microgenomates bacterium]|nr:aminotransferase class I/II-fold pyridoxal phosphate-dependent enzyme [Candidatus Microgenomates bacterium]